MNKKQLLDYAFEEAVNKMNAAVIDADLVEKFIETAMMGYAENNGYEFTKEEIHATIVAGLEELAKSGANQNFQTWTMK